LWRCDCKGSAVPGVNMGWSSLRKAPWGRRTIHEGLAEPGPRQVGLQVSRRDPSEVPSQGLVRKAPTRHRPDPAGSVPSEGYRTGGGEGNARPDPQAVERAPSVQYCDDDRVPQGQECDPDSPGTVAHDRDDVWPEFLGTGLLRQHRRSGRSPDPTV